MRISDLSPLSVNWQNPVNWSHPLNRGLLSWYLNSPHWQGGTVSHDIIGRYNGTLSVMDPATDWIGSVTRPGGWGAIETDGSAEYVNIPSMYAFSASEPFTVMAWLYATDSVNNYAVWAGAATNFQGILMGIQAGPVWRVGIYGSTNTDSSLNCSLNEWHHVVGRFDGTNFELYADGQYAATNTPTFNGTNGTAGFGNAMTKSSTHGWFGLIDDVRFYNRALSVSEIAEVYRLSTIYNPGLLRRRTIFPQSPAGEDALGSPYYYHHTIAGAVA